MPYPVNPVGFNPMFQASMPNDYTNPTNFGSYGGNPSQSGWGLNTSYLTPSFLAPYRPQYSGNANFQMPTMGFGRALNTAIPTPWQPDTPYYANPQMYQARAVSEAGNKITDGVMAAGQFVVPVAIGLATAAAVDSFRFSGGAQADVARMAYGFRSSMPSWLGGSATLSQASYLARSQTLMEAGGHWAGRTAGRGIGLAVHGAVQSASFLLRGGKTIDGLRAAPVAGEIIGASKLGAIGARAAGFAGAAAGSLLLPYALGETIAEGVDAAVFSPYVSGRQTGNMVQDSLRGTYTGGLGSAASPLDVTNVNATKMGFALSRTFTNNLSFDMDASADIYSGATAAGLFKGTQFNTTDMKKRMKDVTQSISLMMSVFNDPSTQEAIERLRTLQEGGGVKSVAGISALSAQYRIASAVTGMGTRELMAGVGNQGQLMYAQAGLMPHLGQYAGLSAISGLTSAYRSGLISSSSMAMMGGVEGATQLSMQAQLGLARNPYFEMVAYNQYANGRKPGSMTENIAAFGQDMASNPIANYGGFMLNKSVTTSDMLRDNPRSVIDLVISRGHTTPGFYGSDGKIDYKSFATVAMSMGLNADQVRALYGQIRGEAIRNKDGSHAAAFETGRAAWLDRQNLTYYKPGTISAVPYEARTFVKGVKDFSSRKLEVGQTFMSNMWDDTTNVLYGLSNNKGVSDPSDYKYDNEAIQNALGNTEQTSWVGVLPLRYRGLDTLINGMSRYNRSKDIERGPNQQLLNNISKLEMLRSTNPGMVPTGTTLTNNQLLEIASRGGTGITDLTDIRAALVALNTRTGGPSPTSSMYENYSKSTSNTMNQAEILQGHLRSGKKKVGGNVVSVYDHVKHIIGVASESERNSLLVFIRRYNKDLGDVNSFLIAANNEPRIKKILYKLGFAKAFEGTGQEATAEGQRALNFIRSTIVTAEDADRGASIIGEAAHLAIGDDFIREVSVKEINENMAEAKKRVLDSNRKSYSIDASVASARSSPDELLSGRANDYSLRDKVGKQVGDTEELFNFKGLIQASTDQKTAADIMMAAAQLQLINARPDPIRNPQEYVGWLGKMSAAKAAEAKVGGNPE